MVRYSLVRAGEVRQTLTINVIRIATYPNERKKQQAEPDLMPIEFLVVGGSIAGLSAAIALRRAGHKVTVFDIENPFEATPIDAGCRLPPNSTKMYYRWGLEERLHACAVRCKGTIFAQYDSGSVVGSHEWQEDVLLETGGDFLFIHYTDIRRILAECAAEHGATIRYGPENTVAKITAHATKPSIELASGEVLTADVVVGADGYLLPGWIARKYLLEAHAQEDTKKPTGMQMFNVVVRESDMEDQGEYKEFLEMLRTSGKVVTWYGSKYGAFGYPMKAATTGEPAFTLYVYAPLENEGDPLHARNSTRDALLDSIKGADPRLMQLAKHAAHVAAIPMVDHPMLEDWVHPDGRFICIGEAAHPTQVGSVYAFGMSTGDAAVLGRLFKYLHRPEQIDTFLSAVQEIRESRVKQVMKTSAGNIFAVSLPPGMAEARDRRLQERAEEGIAGLASGQTSEQMIETVESVFAYDPEDQADNWWVEWGVMQERAERWSIRDEDSPPGVDFGVSVSTTVDS